MSVETSTTVTEHESDKKAKKKSKKKKCKYCGRVYKNAIALEEHHRNNLHQIYHKVEKNGTIVCEICKEKFPNFDSFYRHWKDDYSHDNDAWAKYRFRIPERRKGKWTVHPIHKELVKKHIRKDKEKWILKQHRNATHLLVKALEFGFAEESWNTCQIVGPTGHGKSAAGIMLGQWMCDYVEQHPDMFEDFTGRPELHITHSLFETADKFRTAKPYSTILQDEAPNLQGRGQKWFAASLETLMNTMRAARVNLIFCTPNVLEELKTIQFIIEIYARWKSKKRTWGYLYDPERSALGECFLDVSTTLKSEEYKKYLKKKMDNIEALKQSGGSLSAQVSEERRNEDIDRVVRGILSSDMIPEDQLPNISLERVMGAATYLVDGIESYQKEVSYYAQHMIRQQFKPSPEEARKSRTERFSVESECKQLLESEFYKLVVERKCNTKATIRYASELFDWEKYRGHLFESKANWERVCRVIIDVVAERILDELEEDEDTGEDDSELVPQRRQDVDYNWTEWLPTEDAMDIMVEAVKATMSLKGKKYEKLRWGACAFKHYILLGKTPQEAAARDVCKEMGAERHYNMMFRQKRKGQSAGYMKQFILGKGKGKLGWAVEEAMHRLRFTKSMGWKHEGGQGEPDLVHNTEPPIECKTRDTLRNPNRDELQLFDGKEGQSLLNRKVANREPMYLVVVTYGYERASVTYWKLTYLDTSEV